MNRELPILVVGGGIGGMSAAIALAARGDRVDLVEIDPDWKVYGAGITVTGPTYRAFRALGVVDDVLARGFGCRGGTRICDPGGRVLAELPGEQLDGDLPPLGGIMRPVLHDILSSRTLAVGVNVRLGVTASAWCDDGEVVDVEMSDGSRHGYAAVIIADGAFSANRERLFPDAPSPVYTGQYCWRIVARRLATIDRAHVYSAGEVFAGLMPTGADSMYMFLLETRAEKSRVAAVDQARILREIMAPFGGVLGRLRDELDEASSINVRPLDAIILPPPWHLGRVILIGDAAHSTTPHLASGAGIAVEDAVILANMLAADHAVERVYERFTDLRFERCRDVVESSIEIGALQQNQGSPDTYGGLIRAAETRLRADVWTQHAAPALSSSR